MGLDDLVGAAYGPCQVRASAEQVAAYVAATGDDPERWVEHAPPSFAGALLFAVAPGFFGDPEIVPYTRRLVHVDQAFTWRRAVEVEENLTVEGTCDRVRERGGMILATFTVAVRSGGESVIDSVSTFLMGAEGPPEDVVEEDEPPIGERGVYDPAPPDSTVLPEVARSASRLDLIRYAAASGDFNPVHFDHRSAVEAGFPGVLVHGLLMGAWVLQWAASLSGKPDGIESAKLRFRNPLRPAVATALGGTVKKQPDGAPLARLTLRTGETELVSARVRLGGS